MWNFSPTSLVGMTQGARKRHIRKDARWANARTAARARFHLGERLRPCPGKHGCVNCTRTCGACEDQIPDDTTCPRCGSVMTTAGPFCDGSGVLQKN